jgi:hypothetical protein
MDISQVVGFSKFLLTVAVSWAILRIARPIRHRWLRISIRTIVSLLFVCSVILVFFLLIVQAGCTKSAPPIYAPDGRHVAILHYALQGALGDDYAIVDLRRRWTPWAENVYRGLGAWDFKHERASEPEVRWIDSSHLLIRFVDDRIGNEGRGGRATCLSQAGAVQIVCEPVMATGQ